MDRDIQVQFAKNELFSLFSLILLLLFCSWLNHRDLVRTAKIWLHSQKEESSKREFVKSLPSPSFVARKGKLLFINDEAEKLLQFCGYSERPLDLGLEVTESPMLESSGRKVDLRQILDNPKLFVQKTISTRKRDKNSQRKFFQVQSSELIFAQ